MIKNLQECLQSQNTNKYLIAKIREAKRPLFLFYKIAAAKKSLIHDNGSIVFRHQYT